MKNIILIIIVSVAVLFPHKGITQNKTWSLKDCIEYAYKNNVALNQQILTTEISKINYKQARDNRLPNLNFTDAQNFNFGNNINANTNQVIHQNTNGNYPALNSSVTLFGGYKYINLIKESKLYYEAGQLDIETQKNNLALNITAAYMQVLFEYDAVSIAQHQIEADSVQVSAMAKYVVAGQSPEDSLYQIQAQLAADRAAKVNAENQVVLANVQLEQLMELPIDSDFLLERPDQKELSAEVIAQVGDIFKIAEGLLPDEKSAALKTKAVETDLSVNKAALMPTLNLSVGLSTEYYSALTMQDYKTVYQNETIGYLQSNPSQLVAGPVPVTTSSTLPYTVLNQFNNNFSQLIALNLTVPIFNNYKARNNIHIAKVAISNARLNEQAVKNTLRKNVELACTDQRAASKNYLATKEQLFAETRSYTDMQKKLNAGLINVTDFLVEENKFYKVLISNLQARYEYIFKTKVVDFYTGTSLTNQ